MQLWGLWKVGHVAHLGWVTVVCEWWILCRRECTAVGLLPLTECTAQLCRWRLGQQGSRKRNLQHSGKMIEDRDAELMHLEHHKTPLQGAGRASDASHGEQEVLQWCTVHEAAMQGPTGRRTGVSSTKVCGSEPQPPRYMNRQGQTTPAADERHLENILLQRPE